MTHPTLDEMIAAESGRLMELLMSGEAPAEASWVAFLPDGTREIIDTPLPDNEDWEAAKMLVIPFVQWQMREMGAWGYTVATVIHDPEVVEFLVVAAVTRKGKLSRTWQVSRAAGGDATAFSLYAEADGGAGPVLGDDMLGILG
jgi:hypothetical protein